MAITTGSRRNGKTAAMLDAIREALTRGEHVHIAGPAGLRCVDGPDDCTVTRRTLAQLKRDPRH